MGAVLTTLPPQKAPGVEPWPRAVVSTRDFYAPWHGHTAAHLHALVPLLRVPPPHLRVSPPHAGAGDSSDAPVDRRVVWLTGDSVLDNKAWAAREPGGSATAANGYARLLDTPRVVADVAHCVNAAIVARGLGSRLVCVNAATEENTVAEPGTDAPQAAARRALSRAGDLLVVSLGGNDVLLRPTAETRAALAAVCTRHDDLARAAAYAHFRALFCEGLLGALTRRGVPTQCALVVVCSPYAPCERGATDTPGWADAGLASLGYDDPIAHAPGPGGGGRGGVSCGPRARLQALVRDIHAAQVAFFQDRGRALGWPFAVRVVALHTCLDTRPDSPDFVARVEPSAVGAGKIAHAIVAAVTEAVAV